MKSIGEWHGQVFVASQILPSDPFFATKITLFSYGHGMYATFWAATNPYAKKNHKDS
jgi:hypothetical protein